MRNESIASKITGVVLSVFGVVLLLGTAFSQGPLRQPAINSNLPVSPAIVDPCSKSKGNAPISQAANAQVITGQQGMRIAICYALIVPSDAENISIVEGTGSTCATNTSAVVGGTTAANGPNFPAGGGYSAGNGGATVHSTSAVGDNVCIFQSGSGRVAGVFEYVFFIP